MRSEVSSSAEGAAAKRAGQTTTAACSPNVTRGEITLKTHLVIDMAKSRFRLGMPSTKLYKIASIPGDGIGPEVISAAITVLQKLASTLGTFSLQVDHLSWSSESYKKHGRYIPEGGLEELRKYDAILFGSVGDPGSALANPHLESSQY